MRPISPTAARCPFRPLRRSPRSHLGAHEGCITLSGTVTEIVGKFNGRHHQEPGVADIAVPRGSLRGTSQEV